VFAPNGNVSAEIGVLVALFIAIAEKNAGVGALIVVHVNCLLLSVGPGEPQQVSALSEDDDVILGHVSDGVAGLQHAC
jgi:hypothetical protein